MSNNFLGIGFWALGYDSNLQNYTDVELFIKN